MEEFNSRMSTQRNILKIINQLSDNKEELCGLSKKAIERWISVNNIGSASNICNILYKISERLFFLATKSQEQISEKYKLLTSEIIQLQTELKMAVEKK